MGCNFSRERALDQFLPAAAAGPPALALPFLDFLDRDQNFTLGYICTAEKAE
jgi:hypothetical protein